MRVESGGSLGDEIALIGALRAFREAFPSERIALTVRYPEVFERLEWLDGPEENGNVFRLRLGGDPTNREHLVTDYASQLGVNVYDLTPDIELDENEIAYGAGLIDSLRGWGTERFVAVDTWAGWPSRRYAHWPEVFASLAAIAPGLGIIEVGKTVGDCDGQTRAGARLGSIAVDMVDKLTVRETASVIAACDLYVGSDSGLAHLAAAVGTPQVVLYGPKPYWTRAYKTTFPVIPVAPCACSAEHCAQGCVSTISPFRIASAITASTDSRSRRR